MFEAEYANLCKNENDLRAYLDLCDIVKTQSMAKEAYYGLKNVSGGITPCATPANEEMEVQSVRKALKFDQ